MATPLARFWKRFRKTAEEQNAVVFGHKPGKPWESNRHVGERPRKFAHFVYNIHRNDADVSLQIHAKRGDAKETKRIYDLISSHRRDIEEAFGDRLEWPTRPKSDIATIRYRMADAGYADEERWSEVQHRMIETMNRLMDSFKIAIDTVPFPVEEHTARRRAA